jgi:NADP oxidoreductase coenzyme F420-dependent
MLIAIIGAGAVGKALGLNWLKCGHDVRFGVRNPDDAKYVALGRDRLFESTAGIPAADVIVGRPRGKGRYRCNYSAHDGAQRLGLSNWAQHFGR